MAVIDKNAGAPDAGAAAAAGQTAGLACVVLCLRRWMARVPTIRVRGASN